MFKFFRKKGKKDNSKPQKNDKKKSKKVDNLIMGVVIGGAIASVLGVGISQQKKKNKLLINQKKMGSMKKLPNEIDQ